LFLPGIRRIPYPTAEQQPQDQIVDQGHHLGRMAGLQGATVFLQRHVLPMV
jgi:hypothetical protein